LNTRQAKGIPEFVVRRKGKSPTTFYDKHAAIAFVETWGGEVRDSQNRVVYKNAG
jgi:hypothetical protein